MIASKSVLLTTCSLRENKMWKNSQPFRKEWGTKLAVERTRRINNLKDTITFVTDIAKEDVGKFKTLHLEAFEGLRKNTDDKRDDVVKHEVDHPTIRSTTIFDEDER